MSRHHLRASGFSLPELAFGILIFAIASVVLINHLSINYQSTLSERDRVFAYSKAQAILSEIQNYVDRGQANAAVDLDVIDDGVVNTALLTIQNHVDGTPLQPDAELSGNYRDGSASTAPWKWSRRITVLPFAGLNNRNVRYVTVRMFKRDQSGVERPVADLSAVINSAGDGFPTTQVFDVYLLAVESIPGWWVYMDSIRPFVESAINDLETRNPGLEVHTHWITKASFGRNLGYRPYFNEAQDSWQAIPKAYFYPAKMPAGMSSAYYYVPANVSAHIDLDGLDTHGYDPILNPHPYALADFFNHSMRYPDELALWQQRVADVTVREQAIAADVAAGNPPQAELDDMSKEPTLRLFLEDLNTSPLKYKNALIINLHGELLPMPSLRNVSDPAKSPVACPEMRVVTHPEELRTQHAVAGVTTAARFRVYAFNTNTQTYAGAAATPVPIAVEVVGVNLIDVNNPTKLDAAVGLQNLRGGVVVGGVRDYLPFAASKHSSDARVAGEMYYTAQFVDPGAGQEKFTRILLYNTPVIAPPVADAAAPARVRGLFANERSQLYWMSYIPCSCDNPAPQAFARDLYAIGDGPKNTARWRFSVPPAFINGGRFVNANGVVFTPASDIQLAVRTRLWTGASAATSGTMWPVPNDPDNLSTTYTWWAATREAVPFTERAQFQGDPRHCPYKDLLNGDPDFSNAYNWDHDLLTNGGENSVADYIGINGAALRNRWRGRMSFDVGRVMEVWRKGLVASGCVYTTLTGFSYYYIGLGDDIGYDSANGYPNSIPVEFTPLGSPGTRSYLNTITGSRKFVRDRRGTYWFGLPWLGELCPDWAYSSQWLAVDAGGKMRGNLDAGTGGSQFYQVDMNTAYSGSNRTAYGTTLNNSVQCSNTEGCTSFFNVGNAAATFHHQFADGGIGTLTATGAEIANNYNFAMPTTAAISRPFGVNVAVDGTIGDEFSLAPYSAERFTPLVLRTYYTHPNRNVGSGLVKLTNNAGTSSAFLVVNGLDNTTSTGTSFLGKWAVLSLVHSYFEAGNTAVANRIKMPPRVTIVTPNDISELRDPASIAIQYSCQWERWDGLPYTASGTFGESEAELQYAIYYSNDGGDHWYYVQDGLPGTPGARPAAAYLVNDAASGNETYLWTVPASQFPEGSYLLRIDCFRLGAQVHFSYHKAKFFIKR